MIKLCDVLKRYSGLEFKKNDYVSSIILKFSIETIHFQENFSKFELVSKL